MRSQLWRNEALMQVSVLSCWPFSQQYKVQQQLLHFQVYQAYFCLKNRYIWTHCNFILVNTAHFLSLVDEQLLPSLSKNKVLFKYFIEHSSQQITFFLFSQATQRTFELWLLLNSHSQGLILISLNCDTYLCSSYKAGFFISLLFVWFDCDTFIFLLDYFEWLWSFLSEMLGSSFYLLRMQQVLINFLVQRLCLSFRDVLASYYLSREIQFFFISLNYLKVN